MNHTIKGILIAAAITSMLVLGTTTMVPIMQNSFAHKKEGNNQEHGNANVNENTVTGTSSSDASVTNTNNINNTNTQSQSQGQNACLIAGECTEEVTPPPTTATCVPPTVGGQTATPEDGICIATIPASAGSGQCGLSLMNVSLYQVRQSSP